MKRCFQILFLFFVMFYASTSILRAQNYASATAQVTATVIPAIGVEIQKTTNNNPVARVTYPEILLNVNDYGRYAVKIMEETNKNVIDKRLIDYRGSYRLTEEIKRGKKIVQIIVLSS